MFVPILFVVLGFMEYAEITDMMMMMRETQNYCLCLNPFEKRCRMNEKKVGLSKPHFLCLRASCLGKGRVRAATQSRHPDTRATPTPRHPNPSRHPDTPTPQGRCCICKPMQGDARGCKGMQGDARGCKRKSKERGGKGKG